MLKITFLKYLLLVTLTPVFILGCGFEAKAEKKDKEETQIPVEITEVITGDISSSYANASYIVADKDTQVVAKTNGIVEQLFVEEGDYVEQGQALAQLETEQLQLELKQAKANLMRLKNELERNKKIYSKKLVSSDNFERLKYEYESQQASFELSQLRLEYATIRAPFSGIISERLIKLGNMVSTNGPTFRLTDFNSLKGEIFVPELQLNMLKKGQPAYIAVDALAEQNFTGSIERISPVIDKQSGTFKVTIALDNKQGKLRPGMFARFTIIADTHNNALLVDKNSIIAQDEEHSVFLVKDGKAIKTPVTTGFIQNDQIEILTGLAAGDQIVTTGLHTLKDNSKVKILQL